MTAEKCCFEFEPKGLPKQGTCGPVSLEEDGFDSLPASSEHRASGGQGECGWEDRGRDGRAREVAGMTLGRIGNTNAAIARITGQGDGWEGTWKGETQKQP